MWHARALLAVVLVLSSALPDASAAVRPVRVGLVGDSIVEDGGVTSPTSLAAALRAELGRHGYDAADWGYVPAHGSDLHLQRDGSVTAPPWRYAGAWTFLGLTPLFDPASSVPHVLASPFGPDGHAAAGVGPLAGATAEIAGDRFAVLFVRAPDAGTFRFSVDGRTRIVDAYAPAVDGGGIAWLRAPRDGRATHTVEVAALRGPLWFSGVLSEPAAARGRVEVLSLGRSCACATDAFPSAQQQALAALRLDVTVLLLGLNDQGSLAAGGGDATRAGIVSGLRARGILARRHGGTCVVVPPAPNARPPAVQREVRALERQAAELAGCRYAPVFQRLWSGTDSVAEGYTVDGIHPTASGFREMAGALAALPPLRSPAARPRGRARARGGA